jgi:hypothetical protein
MIEWEFPQRVLAPVTEGRNPEVSTLACAINHVFASHGSSQQPAEQAHRPDEHDDRLEVVASVRSRKRRTSPQRRTSHASTWTR